MPYSVNSLYTPQPDRIQCVACDLYYEFSLIDIVPFSQTVSSNLTFILAMVLYPEAQRRGQEEVDRVLGKGNLPTLDDLGNLPYVEAMYKEILRYVSGLMSLAATNYSDTYHDVDGIRWHPSVGLPLIIGSLGPCAAAYILRRIALPHCTSADDVHNGYFIPKETMVLPNVWYGIQILCYVAHRKPFNQDCLYQGYVQGLRRISGPGSIQARTFSAQGGRANAETP